MVRFGTLPLVHKYLAPRSRLVLDDALRPEELAVAGRWSKLPYVSNLNLCLRGKGLVLGRRRGYPRT